MNNKYILTKEEYTQLEKDALNLLIDYAFVSFPIDVFKLAETAFDAEVIKYSSLSEQKIQKLNQYDAIKDGFTVVEYMSNGHKRYKIYYNDKCNIYRQRYTIGHEIKHIYYGEENITKREEVGAEYFSKVLIAPKCMIISKNIQTIEGVVETFNLSYKAATNHLKGINHRIEHFGNELFSYEKDFINNLESILKKF